MKVLLVVWLAAVGGTGSDTLAVRPESRLPAMRVASPLATPVAPAAVGLHPVIADTLPPRLPPDLAVAIRVREAGIQRDPVVRATAEATRVVAFPGALLLAAALYGVGELDDRPDLATTGERTGLAIVTAGAVAVLGKVVVGRSRPTISPDDPYEMRWGRGIRGDSYQSFPSAHTAIAFATAVALSAEVSERHRSARGWVIPTSYGTAALAGLSRIFHEQHWASDVIAGAAIGALSGWAVTH